MAGSNRNWLAPIYPFFWAGAAFAGFYTLLSTPLPGAEFLRRYTTGHPVEYIEMALFFLGMAVLVVKLFQTVAQRSLIDWLRRRVGEAVDASRQREHFELEPLSALLSGLEQLPHTRRESFPIRRVSNVLEHLVHRQSTEGLEERAVILSDQDRDEQYRSFSFVRLIIWAIPILGFLGTVIGIALALGNLSPRALEETLPQVMSGLTVAFDTTALALALSIVLMFFQYLVDRFESGLLSSVDRLVEEDLLAELPPAEQGPSSELASVRRMMESVIAGNEAWMRRQSDMWKETSDQVRQCWMEVTEEASERIGRSLSQALEQTVTSHAQHLTVAEQQAEGRIAGRWQQMLERASAQIEELRRLQTALTRQAEVMARVAQATDQITHLESALNRNLAALSGAQHFEETVTSLAAAVNLLSSHLDRRSADSAPQVRLEENAPARSGEAA